jgi:HK97 family phage prohead protease
MTIKSWSQFTVKAFDDEQRIITGIATTPSTDREFDVIDPQGATFKLPIPLLSQHDATMPIGMVTRAKVTPSGIEIEAQIPKNTDIDYVEDAWKQIKAGLIRGLSVGFRALKVERNEKDEGRTYRKWEWLELSAVTVAANQDCSITGIKNLAMNSNSTQMVESKAAFEDAHAVIKRANNAYIQSKRILRK